MTDIPAGSVITMNGLKFVKLRNDPVKGAQFMALQAAPPMPVSCASTQSMQGWTGCTGLATPTGTNFTQGPILTDCRDQKTYEIRKFSDGKCWMVDNLRFGGATDACAGKTTFSGNGSSTATNQFGAGTYGDCRDAAAAGGGGTLVAPCSGTTACGYYYNWQGAMQAQNAYYNVSFTTPSYPHQGICPQGWHLPRGGTNTDLNSEFVKLSNCANGNCNATGDGIQTGFFQAGGNWKGLLSGYSGSTGTLNAQGSDANFWSSTEYSAANAYNLYFNSSYVYPAGNYYKNYGFSVRCIKN